MVRYVYKRGYFTLSRALFALLDRKLVFLTLHHFYHPSIAPSFSYFSKLNSYPSFFIQICPYTGCSDSISANRIIPHFVSKTHEIYHKRW